MSSEIAKRFDEATILDRAARVQRAHVQVSATFAVRDRSPADRARWEQAAQDLHGALHDFYGPLSHVVPGVRLGDRSAIDDAFIYLDADPWCFRSGYLKADLMRRFANRPVDRRDWGRLQTVVLHRADVPQPRLVRAAARLAAAVWDDALADGLTRRAADPESATSSVAATITEWATAQLRGKPLPLAVSPSD